MADDLDDLQRLAPAVDSDRARVAFRRRRRRSRSMRRGGMALVAVSVLVVGTVGVVANLDDEAPLIAGPGEELPTGPVTFEVVHVAEANDEMGRLRSAVDEGEYEALWLANESDARPTIDFDEQVVVSITIPDDACPPELTSFDRDGAVLTPVFVETAEACVEPLIPKTFVVAIDRSAVGSTFTLRLPADPTFGFDEQRLVVDLSGEAAPIADVPRVWVMPEGDCCEQAGLGGIVYYDHDLDCFFLGGHDRALVWPQGTVGTADGPGVILPGGQVVRDGDAVGGGGATRTRDRADELGIAPECVTDRIATIQYSEDVTVTPSVNAASPEPTCAEIEAFVASVPDMRPLSDYTSSESPEQLLAEADLVVYGELTGAVEVDDPDVAVPHRATYGIETSFPLKAPDGMAADRVISVVAPSPVPLSDEDAVALREAAVPGIPVILFAYSLSVYPGFTIGIEGLMTGCPGEPPIGFVSPRPEWAEVETLAELVSRLEQAP